MKWYEEVLQYLYLKIEDYFHNKRSVDIKCDNCNEWFGVSALKYTHKYAEDTPFGCASVCGQCGHKSYWRLDAPVPIRCDEQGIPFDNH